METDEEKARQWEQYQRREALKQQMAAEGITCPDGSPHQMDNGHAVNGRVYLRCKKCGYQSG